MGMGYLISMTKKSTHDVYFTDENGFNFLSKKDGVLLQFEDLPKPLLKQIK